MARLHPYEYTYFNRLAGGVDEARGRYMLDYWGLSFKQAAQALEAKLAAERGEEPPKDRPWKLAVCGPHRSPQVELGAGFRNHLGSERRRFRHDAGRVLLREFDAPVMAEITRAGTVYARVYDIRGRSFESLLTQPGLGGK